MTYIPRPPVSSKGAPSAIPLQVRKRRTIHMFNILGTTLLVASCLGAVGSFFYKDIVEKQLANAQDKLRTVSNTDDARKIEEIRVYDNKLTIANTLLDTHIAPSRIFEELEDSTKQTVQFKSLEFTYDPGFEATLTLSGNADEFTSVALQKMQFFKDTLFSNFITKNIATSKSATVTNGITNPNAGETVDFSIVGIFKNGVIEYTGTEEEKSITNTVIGDLGQFVSTTTNNNEVITEI